MDRTVIVTADDFGLAPEINVGIVEAHSRGLVTSTSLLMNAPATGQALELAKANSRLEIGLHLSLVEGYSLSGSGFSLLDQVKYFPEKPCLHRHWKTFIPRFVTGRIRLPELEMELRAQFEAFLSHFPSIPFMNGTQHLHLLPVIQDLVLRLACDYQVKWLRAPYSMISSSAHPARSAYTSVMKHLGRRLAAKAERHGIRTTDHFAGFDSSGSMNEEKFCYILSHSRPGLTEVMVHPGKECAFLKRQLPVGYATFGWETELEATVSSKVKSVVQQQNIKISAFGQVRGGIDGS
jgi:predicted glycoside hydrolase/deacetylase ChbG (UPF0249 family)